ncbi:hypothetical protein FB567DRAFT_565062 [Paraphoma chrysanthemicola]|uniref:Uncharacterized protein n=1 Tax=Paraphoma chrysanthemicola TaxID=798071 RepID=A0A8K0VRY1_9PLEO|nr:hypothetical protein FB567DRAFT_565062 [Paraphoma chrysanthemicola]
MDRSKPLSPNAATPDQKIRLDELPNDIHHLIASELTDSCPSTVLALGQTSKTLRQAALPFGYRNLVLKKEAKALIKSLREEEDGEITKHVRGITVKDGVPTEDLMNILNKVSEHGTLTKLSWETSAHMPCSVLEKLQTTWPDLALSVCVLDRQEVTNHRHRQMDVKLLSSPLLRTLTYNVYNQGYYANEPARSEWPKLTQAIAKGGSVRVLNIDNRSDGSPYSGAKVINDDDEDPGKYMRLDLTPGLRLPALEEFTMRSWGNATYLWDDAHAQMLRDAMDWSRLRKLDFGSDRPDAFFSAMTGTMPNLRSLRFGTQDGVVGPAQRFLDSIDALESLDIGRAQGAIDTLWPSILNHKDTLRELILHPTFGSYYSHHYIDLDRLETIRKEFPLLERLGWDAPCTSNIDSEHLKLLSRMNLKKLDLFLHVPFTSSAYAAELVQNAMGSIPAPKFTREAAQTAAIGLMNKLSLGKSRPLEWLTIQFTRTGLEDRAQPYLMFADLQVRQAKTGSGYEVRGKQEWVGWTTLEDELRLMED